MKKPKLWDFVKINLSESENSLLLVMKNFIEQNENKNVFVGALLKELIS